MFHVVHISACSVKKTWEKYLAQWFKKVRFTHFTPDWCSVSLCLLLHHFIVSNIQRGDGQATHNWTYDCILSGLLCAAWKWHSLTFVNSDQIATKSKIRLRNSQLHLHWWNRVATSSCNSYAQSQTSQGLHLTCAILNRSNFGCVNLKP